MSYQDNETIRLNPGFRKPSFSSIEIRDILISMLVLSVAFTIIFASNNTSYFSKDVVTNTLCWLGISLVIVASSFIMHEFGHKFVAQRYGAWAEYRMFPGGLVMCIIFSLLGFLFAAPGAVYINGRISKEMNGKISAAGPMVNLILGSVSFLICYSTTGIVSGVFGLFTYLNAFLALFNMIPVMPLDGSKIVRWNIPIYIGMAAVGALLVYLYFTVLI
ncbi:MAG: site-2 protease family protein [Candidatus Methanomethylophilaceae archaeon]